MECQRILNSQKQGVFKYSSFKLRLFNELATVFLVAIVFLVVVKSTAGLLWGILGLIAFAAIIMLCVAVYKRNSVKDNVTKTPEDGSKEIKP